MNNTMSLPSRNNYRSIRYTISRQENLRTADPSSLPKFRIKRNSVLESTMYRTNFFDHQMSKTLTINNNNNNEEQKSIYMKTFTSMMNPTNKMTIQQKNTWMTKPLKFKIQNFKELNDSQFTLLDPFQRHLKSIQTQTKKAEQQLSNQSSDIKLIRGELQNLKKRTIMALDQIKNSSSGQIQKFRSFIKNNTIHQQQTKLRFKSQICKLQIQHKQNATEFQNIMGKNHCLQQTIFNCTPFQLKQNQQWNQIQGNQTLGIKNGTLC